MATRRNTSFFFLYVSTRLKGNRFEESFKRALVTTRVIFLYRPLIDDVLEGNLIAVATVRRWTLGYVIKPFSRFHWKPFSERAL